MELFTLVLGLLMGLAFMATWSKFFNAPNAPETEGPRRTTHNPPVAENEKAPASPVSDKTVAISAVPPVAKPAQETAVSEQTESTTANTTTTSVNTPPASTTLSPPLKTEEETDQTTTTSPSKKNTFEHYLEKPQTIQEFIPRSQTDSQTNSQTNSAKKSVQSPGGPGAKTSPNALSAGGGGSATKPTTHKLPPPPAPVPAAGGGAHDHYYGAGGAHHGGHGYGGQAGHHGVPTVYYNKLCGYVFY